MPRNCIVLCFNPRAPCGARRRGRVQSAACRCFNPRAPCGARLDEMKAYQAAVEFQSTRPMRGATAKVIYAIIMCHVSIHAPHAGRDHFFCAVLRLAVVSIHAPHAGRDQGGLAQPRTGKVSIHAPHAGRDNMLRGGQARQHRFNPRAPCGARRRSLAIRLLSNSFNPRAPCGARHSGA